MGRRRALFSGIIPDEYQELKWVDAPAGAYIDTGIIANGNTGVEFCLRLSQNSYCSVLGSLGTWMSADGGFGFQSKTNMSQFLFTYKDTRLGYYMEYSENHDYTISTKSGDVYIDDTKKGTYTVKEFPNSYSIILFGYHNENGDVITEGSQTRRLYYAKFYDGSTLISSIRFVRRRSDNVIGAYDVIRKQFFASFGTAQMIAGDPV